VGGNVRLSRRSDVLEEASVGAVHDDVTDVDVDRAGAGTFQTN